MLSLINLFVCVLHCGPLTELLTFPCTSPSANNSFLKLRLNSISSWMVRPAVRAWYFSTMDQRECSRISKRTSLSQRRWSKVKAERGQSEEISPSLSKDCHISPLEGNVALVMKSGRWDGNVRGKEKTEGNGQLTCRVCRVWWGCWSRFFLAALRTCWRRWWRCRNQPGGRWSGGREATWREERDHVKFSVIFSCYIKTWLL